jgi:arylsulfatase A-like enzyme
MSKAAPERRWRDRLSPPPSAPNVVVVLVDDLGFADVGCYGAEIDTPNVDALADAGLRYTNFHATPLCSPSRAALLTGLNPHAAGVGYLVSGETGYPGYQGQLDPDAVTLAELFRANGYRTLMVGKWHLTSIDDTESASSRASWPLQRGFDRFYGFLDAALTNLHHPARLHLDNHEVVDDSYPHGYYFTDDITDRAVEMIRAVRNSAEPRPFFLYVAHAAVHAPLMAKPAEIGKYAGRFAAGWDALREERFVRQRTVGVVPASSRLPDRNGERAMDVPPWSSLTAEERHLFARHMEVYAAMVDSVDQSVGRIRNVLADMGELDNTIFVFTSDNGASREGGPTGTTEYYRTLASSFLYLSEERSVERDLGRLDLLGGPQVMSHYPRGWSMVSNTPFRLYKGTVFAGGHHVPFVISWPAKIAAQGETRAQYAHLIDVLPTLTELVGLSPVCERAGRQTKAPSGSSFAESLDDAGASPHRRAQYYEVGGHKGFYRDGWEALTLHYPGDEFDEDRWQLFHVADDPAQVDDLAGAHPDIVDELVTGWEQAALDNDVFPLADSLRPHSVWRAPVRPAPTRLVPGSPTLGKVLSNSLIKHRSFRIDVRVEHGPGAEGTLVAHGDQGGGYALYLIDDCPVFVFNAYGETSTIVADARLDAGARTISVHFVASDEHQWRIELEVDGAPVGADLVVPMLIGLAPWEGITVGRDPRSPVSWEISQAHGAYPFRGRLIDVTYVPQEAVPDADELVRAEADEALSRSQ